jgi:LruC domain-containing protein
MATNPLVADTDQDGVGDCVEVAQGTDPLRDTSFPDADLDGVSDGADPFPCDAEKSAVLFMPGEGQYGTLMFEDNWPRKGDLDFNDAVLAYNYAIYYNSAGAVSHVVLTLDPLAIGATFHSGLALHVPVSGTSMESAVRSLGGVGQVPLATNPGETSVVVTITDDIRNHFNQPEGYINTEPQAAMIDGEQIVVSLHFSPAVPLPRGEEPFDLYFFRTANPQHQVHRPPFAGTAIMDGALFGTDDDASDLSPGGRRFIDGFGMPFVLSMPALVPWPREFVDIAHLFPEIVEFAASGGTLKRDFYSTIVNAPWAYPPSMTLQTSQATIAPIVPYVPSRACTPVPPGG